MVKVGIHVFYGSMQWAGLLFSSSSRLLVKIVMATRKDLQLIMGAES
jgi:hypothetical protein